MNASIAPAVSNHCLCGCGRETSPTANYRPGHDASHVSALLASLNAGDSDFSSAAVNKLAKGLPTEALRVKFIHAADKLADKKSSARKSRAPKAAQVEYEEGSMKVGR